MCVYNTPIAGAEPVTTTCMCAEHEVQCMYTCRQHTRMYAASSTYGTCQGQCTTQHDPHAKAHPLTRFHSPPPIYLCMFIFSVQPLTGMHASDASTLFIHPLQYPLRAMYAYGTHNSTVLCTHLHASYSMLVHLAQYSAAPGFCVIWNTHTLSHACHACTVPYCTRVHTLWRSTLLTYVRACLFTNKHHHCVCVHWWRCLQC